MGVLLGLTGSTVTNIEESNATMSEMNARLIIMSHSFLFGVHVSGINTAASLLASTSMLILALCTLSIVIGHTVTTVASVKVLSLSVSSTAKS